jgi:hypothetical protein
VLRTNAAPDVHLHRFAAAPGDLVLAVDTMRWCRCGTWHEEKRRLFICAVPGCGFVLSTPLEA